MTDLLKQIEAGTAALRAKMDELERENGRLTRAFQNAESVASRRKREYDALMRDFRAEQAGSAQLRAGAASLVAEEVALKKELRAALAGHDDARAARINRFRKIAKSARVDLQDMMNDRDEWQQKYEALAAGITESVQGPSECGDGEQLAAEVAKLFKENKKRRGLAEAREREISDLKRQLHDVSSNRARLSRELEAARREAAAAPKDAAETIERLRKQCDQLRRRVDEIVQGDPAYEAAEKVAPSDETATLTAQASAHFEELQQVRRELVPELRVCAPEKEWVAVPTAEMARLARKRIAELLAENNDARRRLSRLLDLADIPPLKQVVTHVQRALESPKVIKAGRQFLSGTVVEATLLRGEADLVSARTRTELREARGREAAIRDMLFETAPNNMIFRLGTTEGLVRQVVDQFLKLERERAALQREKDNGGRARLVDEIRMAKEEAEEALAGEGVYKEHIGLMVRDLGRKYREAKEALQRCMAQAGRQGQERELRRAVDEDQQVRRELVGELRARWQDKDWAECPTKDMAKLARLRMATLLTENNEARGLLSGTLNASDNLSLRQVIKQAQQKLDGLCSDKKRLEEELQMVRDELTRISDRLRGHSHVGLMARQAAGEYLQLQREMERLRSLVGEDVPYVRCSPQDVKDAQDSVAQVVAAIRDTPAREGGTSQVFFAVKERANDGDGGDTRPPPLLAGTPVFFGIDWAPGCSPVEDCGGECDDGECDDGECDDGECDDYDCDADD